MKRSISLPFAFSLLVAAGAMTGCSENQGAPTVSPPEVTLHQVATQQVTDYAEFPGRTEAVGSVEVRSRVTGYLDKILFRAGAEVKKDQPLFQIDPRPFKAALDRAQGQVALAEATVARLTRDYNRNRPLYLNGSLAPQDWDKIVGDKMEAEGSLKAQKANAEEQKLNLEYATIKAPIGGKISRNLITEGNLVTTNATVLATIVSTGEIYAYFDVDENALLRYEAAVRQQKIKPGKDRPGLVELTLADGTVVKGGTVDYVDVQLKRTTGTIQVRATFKDPTGMLKAGQFVRVRLLLGEPHKAVVVPEVAIGLDQGLKYVYVVDDQDKVEYRRVKTGTLHGGMQVIEEGVKPGEWVIVKGLLRVRDGVTVKADRQDTKKAAG
jgi:RND family efflux transporter MFP subunit